MNGMTVCPYCSGQLKAGQGECPFCGRRTQPDPPEGCLPQGTVLAEGRYVLTQCIAQDGEGYTYIAHTKGGELTALVKEYFPVTLSAERRPDGSVDAKAGSEVLFKTTRMDFEDLYRTLQRITPSVGLVAVLDVLRENNTVYAVQERVRGRTLTRVLQDQAKPFRPAEARSLMQPVMEGAASLHKAGLIHRGISPDHILVSEGGVACLAGYGTLGLRTLGSELKAHICDGYAAPEQYAAAEFEGRYTDVYALAAVTYRLVTGQPPLSAQQRKVKDSLEPAQEYSDAVPAFFSDVLEWAMRLDPAQRVQNVPELMGALASQSAANAMQERHKTAESEPEHSKNLLTMIVAVFFVLLLLLGWCVIQLTDRDPPQEQKPDDAASSAETAESAELLEVMPSFVGERYLELQYAEEYLKLYRFVVTESYDSTVEKGVVISQEPAPGTLVTEEGTLVQLVISRGPNLVAMPNIVGFTMENAVTMLNDNGIQFSLLMMANNGEYAAGCVAKTDTPVGTLIDTGTTVVNVYIAAERDNTAAPSYEEGSADNGG